MDGYKSNQVISGTWGEVWCDSDYIAEITGMEAKVSFKTETVSQCRQMGDGTKIMGFEGKGSLKLNKVTSRFINLVSPNVKKGIQNSCTIISKLDDPDSLGCERIKLIDCVFTELTLADWENKKLGEESISFTFRDWEVLDSINA